MSVTRIALLLSISYGITAPAVAVVPLKATRVALGLSRPVYVTAAPGDTSRLFIVEQHTGRIKILDLNTGTINANPFLQVGNLATGGEQGLLGLAFHPDYASNGQFYVNYTAASDGGDTHVDGYLRSSNPDLADTSSPPLSVLSFDQPQTNHNGGWIGFGPNDGYLYIASGDGGNGNDVGPGHTEPGGNAQDITDNPLGKILRVDVNSDDFPSDASRNYAIPRGDAGQPGPKNPFAPPAPTADDPDPADPEGDDEIWSYGLRNPWRASFDRDTGDFYIGDVGQGAREEIDYQPAASAGGENYGWRLREGDIPTPGSVGGDRPPGNVDPIHAYPRDVGATVTGGYVYRGEENPFLSGTYFFGDFGTGKIFALRHNGTSVTSFHEYTGQIATDVGSIGLIASFGEDALGRLYVVDLAGEVFRLIPAGPGDTDFDGAVDLDDLRLLATYYGAPSNATWSQGDYDGDGDVDLNDLAILAYHYPGGQAQAYADFESLNNVPEPALAMWMLTLIPAAATHMRRRLPA